MPKLSLVLLVYSLVIRCAWANLQLPHPNNQPSSCEWDSWYLGAKLDSVWVCLKFFVGKLELNDLNQYMWPRCKIFP
uniref:Secreted protein n=1 Tax=Rhizophora mucronata TaxID=61149 RepID=A0A2P2J4H9_RHIMU